ncbi:MAG: alpha/beta fold hydrolase [Anaerolineales bacterium]
MTEQNSSAARSQNSGTLRKVVMVGLKILLVGCLVTTLIAVIGGASMRRTERQAYAERSETYPAPGTISEGLHLYCRGQSSGDEPTVILEAGSGGGVTSVYGLVESLASETRVCAYDRAGMGWSAPVAGAARTADEITADLYALLTREGIEPPYVIVGHSYGGLLAQAFAGLYPEQTKALVLVETRDAFEEEYSHPAIRDAEAQGMAWYRGFGTAARVGLLQALGPENMAPSVPFFSNTPHPDVRAAHYDHLAHPEHYAAVLSEYEGLSTSTEMAREADLSGVEVWVIEGDDNSDLQVLLENDEAESYIAQRAQSLQAIIDRSAGGEMIAIEGGHNLTEDNPEALTELLRAVLEGESWSD